MCCYGFETVESHQVRAAELAEYLDREDCDEDNWDEISNAEEWKDDEVPSKV